MSPHGSPSAVLVLSTVIFAGLPGPALAGPDPVTYSGSTATFTGDQYDGIWGGRDFSLLYLDQGFPRILTTLSVHSLTNLIWPGVLGGPVGPGVSFIVLGANGSNGGDGYIGGDGGNGVGGLGLTINFAADPWPGVSYWPTGFIMTDGPSAHGITAQSIAGNGGHGGDGYDAGILPVWGGDGGHGGGGGDVNIASDSVIFAQGDGAHGIYALSQGGDGGNGGDAWAGSYVEGGDGGHGGTGGAVNVLSTDVIATTGARAHGIVAQSLGGASGYGGDGGGIFGGAGSGSTSGRGGTVEVTSDVPIPNHDGWTFDRAIETYGTESYGIFAQSVGGFAGAGGGGGGLAFWGGSGASSGDGGAVTVTNTGSIQTYFYGSAAIVGQSIGGGGGTAGDTGGLVAIGGSGSAGGDGGEVDIINNGALTTSAGNASGIIAQSIGGGGGIGAGSGGLISIGGDGNSSGGGGYVYVQNAGAITTAGAESDGIFAQSVGGGGGRAKASGGVISFGGTGGASGDGGDVYVSNATISANLTTTGFDANAILAESIGGGGGRGGGVYGVAPFISSTIGGNAAGGGDGGNVSIYSAPATINTTGAFSHGIFGHTVGGGGGGGGNSLSVAAGVPFSGSTAVGGSGGIGGNGGTVDVTNLSHVTTHGSQAHALFAESLGGGGGAGGNAISLSATIGTATAMGIGLNLAIGGNGGDGGGGLGVDVGNSGDLASASFGADGILAQSIGGGGGSGGNSVSGGLAFESIVASTAIGGAGGGGGSGGPVIIWSSGGIETQGNSAYGILAQSIGGGGGVGGNSLALNVDVTDFRHLLIELVEPQVTFASALGASGGGAGAGGTVDVTSQGPITTQGSFAHGILAQSIGNGGGAGGDELALDLSFLGTTPTDLLGTVALDTKPRIGGTGGSGGSGATVNVDNGNNVTTQGGFAQGILAQSVGGGGGASGTSIEDERQLISGSTSTVELGRNQGGSGNGGSVTVSNTADITTHGGFAHGILAQSIGGGGGFAGISEDVTDSTLGNALHAAGITLTDTPGLGIGFAGSSGGGGSAGSVTVTHSGTITTFGQSSHGILAQSAAGGGVAGPVTVTTGSNIIAYGADSHGILAQSVGWNGTGGDIAVTIGGIVQGGSGNGVGVKIDGGASNTVTNSGDVSALSGVAIAANVGNDTVDNYGVITGTVSLGAGVNAFANHEGAIFNSGPVVDLGAGSALTNAGTLSPGGLGSIADTVLDGDLIELVTGAAPTLEFDIGGLLSGDYDLLDVSGTASLGGILDVSVWDGFPLHRGDSFDILTADTITGVFDSWLFAGRGGGLDFDISYLLDPTGADIVRLAVKNAVPEPFSLVLIGTGVIGIVFVTKGKRASMC